MTKEILLMLLIVAAITFFTRAFVFVCFKNRKPPEFILYLGRVLTPAMLVLLVVYSVKDTNILVYPYGLPELFCIIVAAGLHLWKRNSLLSIFGATALYMVIIQFII